MPTYEYVCTTCATPMEAVQSFHDAALTDCLSCDGGRLRKVYGNVGVVFKGSGFYRTDSRAGHGKSERGKSDGSKSDSSKSDHSKSDHSKSDPSKSDPSKARAAKGDSPKSDGGSSEPARSGKSSVATPASTPA